MDGLFVSPRQTMGSIHQGEDNGYHYHGSRMAFNRFFGPPLRKIKNHDHIIIIN